MWMMCIIYVCAFCLCSYLEKIRMQDIKAVTRLQIVNVCVCVQKKK